MTKVRGLEKERYCAAHIWCWPTSVTTRISGSRSRLMVSITVRGVRMPSRLSASSRSVATRSSTLALH